MDTRTALVRRLISTTGALGAAAGMTLGLAATPASGQSERPVSEQADAEDALWIDAEAKPTLSVSWVDSVGSTHTHSLELPYTEADELVRISRNLDVYVAVGGTRLEVGAGHPRGVVVRLGLFKEDTLAPMFGAIDPATPIEIRLEGVRFRGDAIPRPESIVQHLSYSVDDVIACGLSKEYVNMYNLASEEDNLNNRAVGKRSRAGVIRIDERDFDDEAVQLRQAGLARVGIAPDGSISLWASLPYQLLRHRGDPSKLELPGTFFEPYFFHLEFEAVPPAIAESEFGIDPAEVLLGSASAAPR